MFEKVYVCQNLKVQYKAGVAITPKDISFIWLLNGYYFFETLWHDLFPLPSRDTHSLLQKQREILTSCKKKSMEKRACVLILYYKDVWYMLRCFILSEFQNKI